MSSNSTSTDNTSNGDDSEATVRGYLFFVGPFQIKSVLMPQIQDYSTPLSNPQLSPEPQTSTVHDTSRSKYHMKDLACFASNLEKVIVIKAGAVAE